MRKGDEGDEVEAMQNMLIALDYDLGPCGADGSYGPKTQAAVRQYQIDHGLKVDGIAGNQTMNSLLEVSMQAEPEMTEEYVSAYMGIQAKKTVAEAKVENPAWQENIAIITPTPAPKPAEVIAQKGTTDADSNILTIFYPVDIYDNYSNNDIINVLDEENVSIIEIPSLLSPGSIIDYSEGLFEIVDLTNGYINHGFTVHLDDGYAIINGARSSYALNLGIKGTRYALSNADTYSEVFKYVNPATALKSAFDPKTLGGKLGYAGIALDIGLDTYNNIQEGADAKKIGVDIVVDAGLGAGGIAASAAAGAAIGSIVPGPGNVIGAVVGVAVGVVYTAVTEIWEPGGKSIKDRAKEEIYEVIK